MRHPEWQVLFAQFIEKRQAMSFSWGVHDCCAFAGAWVHLATGQDFFAKYRDTYHTAEQAEELLSKLGGVVGVADMCLPRLETPKQANVGDILLIPFAQPTLAICNGITAYAPGAIGNVGLQLLPRRVATVAWKV